ncbi:HAMP domain-containing histidine kinase [Pyxidicoccus fallax]|uniref:histidine kinase n=1 Tax=Pyxidicoccus fallax TaxID=394095 RepID=A0A848LEJ2_9BACT|nr:HAMP domain-containing sensor histidine kinase [Pyxidicoccus fallax]NMO15263.1 HAMP domain-containing histidine kinase [Pyxidicoccus fallax]NPC77624.1 HAMP domain-containing histidine kinase [Pyxidicoccus fallax]
MLRRLLPTLIALALGLAGLGWGLGYLQRIFAAERDDAQASLDSRRKALEQYARASLTQSLHDRLEAARPAMEAASVDPLMPATGLYLRERGEQLLPRLAQHDTGDDAPARERYTRLRAGTERADEEEDPWAERLALVRAVDGALTRGDRRASTVALMALLQHRAQYVLASTRDVPGLLVVLESLAERGDPVPQLMHALVREGLADGRGGRLDGLQRLLLSRRSRFTREDFTFLRERVAALSTKVGAPVTDFEARVGELAAEPLPLPRKLDGPVLVRTGWYLEPRGGSQVRGVAVDATALLESLTREMRERGLLEADGQVRLLGDAEVLSLDALPLSVETPEWARAQGALVRRYRLKTGMVALCAVLAMGIAALSFVAQRRKYRFLELKSDFVATVSHELRTPLASIRLLAETLEWRLAEGTDARDYPARIVREADGLGFLVENLLSFNRIDKGRWVPKLAPVRLDELVSGLRRDLEAWSKVPVELDAQVDDRTYHADAQLLRLLLSNLARNACAYNTRSPVRLRIESLPDGKVRFSDNGIGIPREQWETVFEEFVRLPGQGRDVPGSGLGLALCRRIMRLHGGSLRVADSSPEGTTFELSFPPTVMT